MPCGPDTRDPIAEALFRTDGFMLLGRGFHPGELSPGDVVRQPSRETARDVLLDKASRLFKVMTFELTSAPYERLGRGVKTSLLNLSAAADLSPTLTGMTGTAAAEAALGATGSESFRVCFVGAHLAGLDLAALEARLQSAQLTELGAGYVNDGQRLFLVTHVLWVSGAVIELDVAGRRNAKVAASQAGLAKMGLRGSVDSRETSSIKLEPVNDSVAIAIRAVEVRFETSGRLEFRGVRIPLTVRGKEESREPTPGTAEAFGAPGPFLNLPRH